MYIYVAIANYTETYIINILGFIKLTMKCFFHLRIPKLT